MCIPHQGVPNNHFSEFQLGNFFPVVDRTHIRSHVKKVEPAKCKLAWPAI